MLHSALHQIHRNGGCRMQETLIEWALIDAGGTEQIFAVHQFLTAAAVEFSQK
jgi:hypothetical protein